MEWTSLLQNGPSKQRARRDDCICKLGLIWHIYSQPPLPGSTENAQSNVHVLNENSVLTSDQLNTFDNISMWVMYGDLKSCNRSKTF